MKKKALADEYPLGEGSIQKFRANGFIKLENVFSAGTLKFYGAEIEKTTAAHNRFKGVSLEERSTYNRAFIQVTNLWTKNDLVREFSHSRKLARIATRLLGTRGVRLWHDQALFKEASGGFTPWHADQQYWPMASSRCVTAWIPLQAVAPEMGPLSFAMGSHLKNIGRELKISEESEREIRRAIREHHLLAAVEPFQLGEVSFHYGWTLHRAGPNRTKSVRRVHTVIFMDVAMRLANPKNANQETDWKAWTPSTRPGEIMDDELNPVLFEEEADPAKEESPSSTVPPRPFPGR